MIASTQTNHPLAGVPATAGEEELLQQACAQLRSHGLRITQPRIAIIRALFECKSPTSIEQIHTSLADGSCDLVTTYRCLAAFEEAGLVKRSFYHNGTCLYDLCIGQASRYHVVCKKTNQLREIDSAAAAQLHEALLKVEQLLSEKGYTNISHVAEFFAVSPTIRDASVRAQQSEIVSR